MTKTSLSVIFYCLTSLLITSCSGYSDTGKTNLVVEKSDKETSETKDYFVGFFGEKTNIPALQIGHAFIGIGRGTPLTCNLDGTETKMFGFYPKEHIEGGKSFWAGPVDGQIKNDVRKNINSYAFKKISFPDYIKVQAKMKEWENKQYELTRNDCISFFQDVAKSFDDIRLPDRSKYQTPEDYVSQFISINKLLK